MDAAVGALKTALAAVLPDPVTMLLAALAPVLVGPRERAVVEDPPASGCGLDLLPLTERRSRASVVAGAGVIQ